MGSVWGAIVSPGTVAARRSRGRELVGRIADSAAHSTMNVDGRAFVAEIPQGLASESCSVTGTVTFGHFGQTKAKIDGKKLTLF